VGGACSGLEKEKERKSCVVRVWVAWDSENPLDMYWIGMHYEKVVDCSINVMIAIQESRCAIYVMGHHECGADSIKM
jgi:hypothetical protein